MRDRYTYEIIESKNILEQKLKKSIGFICWPGGGYNQLSIDIAKEAGYLAMTGSANKMKSLNTHTLKIISRKSMTSFIQTSQRNHYISNSNFLTNLFKYHNGNRLSKYAYYARKFFLIMNDKLT